MTPTHTYVIFKYMVLFRYGFQILFTQNCKGCCYDYFWQRCVYSMVFLGRYNPKWLGFFFFLAGVLKNRWSWGQCKVLYSIYGLSCDKLNVIHIWVHTVFWLFWREVASYCPGTLFLLTEKRFQGRCQGGLGWWVGDLYRPWYNYFAFPSPSAPLLAMLSLCRRE